MSDDLVTGLISPNTSMSVPIGAVVTTRTYSEGEGWATRRVIVTGVKGEWLTTVPDPEIERGQPTWR